MSFLTLILAGTLLLRLPFAHQSGTSHWLDDLFMATSAICVTGLATVDPQATYTLFGELVLMGLVQIGGLGYMTLLTLSLVMVGQRLSLRDRVNFQSATDQPGLSGLAGFILNIARFTLAIEAIGFLFFCLHTVPRLGWGRGMYEAAFHVVMAFNNAGFMLYPEGALRWQGQPYVLGIVMALVVVGGLGYPVNQELMLRLTRRGRRPQWDALVFVVLVTTAIMLLVPGLLIWLFEHANPRTIGPMPGLHQFLNAFFMAAQPRSSGFTALPLEALTPQSLLLLMALMFIGGAPGGTAGGIKVTTAVVLVAAVASAIRGRRDTTLLGMRRRVSDAVVRKALAVLVLSLGFVFLVTLLLLATEPLPLTPILFEAISAIGTVGLSLGVTPQLSDAGKLIVSAAMLIGRVGVVMVMLAIFSGRTTSAVRYPEEPMLVG